MRTLNFPSPLSHGFTFLLFLAACSGRYEVGYEPGQDVPDTGEVSKGTPDQNGGGGGTSEPGSHMDPNGGMSPPPGESELTLCPSNGSAPMPMLTIEPAEAWRRLSAFLLADAVEPEEPLPSSTTVSWLLETAEAFLARPDARVFSRWLESWPLPEDAAAEYGSVLNGPEASLQDLLIAATPGQEQRLGILTDSRLLQAHRTIGTRGDLLLQNLYCADVGTPPPGTELNMALPAASYREHLESVTEAPSCQACHRLLDPLGSSLEHFGPDGEWRELDNGFPIDTSGSLMTPLGFPLHFMGIYDLAHRMTESCEVSRCVARKVFAQALERAHGWGSAQSSTYLQQRARLDPVAGYFFHQDGSFRRLIEAIVLSPEFLGDAALDSAP